MSDYSSKRVSGLYEEVQRYEFKWGCRECGHKWKRTIATNNPLEVEDPACPSCKKAKKRSEHFSAFDPAGGRAPSYANNVKNQALDATAEIIMREHQMTDIRGPTDTRVGESSAPKIPPKLQTMADNMFAPKRQFESMGFGRQSGMQAGMIAQAAMRGAYSPAATGSPDPIAVAQAPRKTVAEVANIINEKRQ